MEAAKEQKYFCRFCVQEKPFDDMMIGAKSKKVQECCKDCEPKRKKAFELLMA